MRASGPPSQREQVQAVKAAMDGGGPPAAAPPPTASAPVPPPARISGAAGSVAPPSWLGRQRWLAAAAVVFVVLPMLTFGMAYLIVVVPKPGDIRTNQVSTILASDGSELAKIVPPEGNRVDVDINQVPVHVRNAVMAAEDRDFYTNPGFSITGFGRALRNNLFGNDIQGGSTITQQYVKNALVGDQRYRLRRPDPQGQGTGDLHQDEPAVVERRSAAGISEHHLLRPQRLRDLRGVAGVFQQAGRPTHRSLRAHCWRR